MITGNTIKGTVTVCINGVHCFSVDYPIAWSARHKNGKCGFVSNLKLDVEKFISLRSGFTIHEIFNA